MVKKINGRLICVYYSPKNEYKRQTRLNFRLSLLGMLLGIFLLPNLAYLSAITPEEIITLTNRERATTGLNPLTANQLLAQAATAKGKAILESQTFKHNLNGRKFSLWVRDAGYNYSYVGENLAVDFMTSRSVVEAWKDSPLHKKNLLSPYYREIGVAAVDGKFQGQDTTVVVQIFGSPAVGSVQPLPLDPGLSGANSNLNFLEPAAAGYKFTPAENLLTHTVLNQAPLPADSDKLMIPAENNLIVKENKFIIQPESYPAANNFLIIFGASILICYLIFLYCYYFLKINKLSAV